MLHTYNIYNIYIFKCICLLYAAFCCEGVYFARYIHGMQKLVGSREAQLLEDSIDTI